MSLTFEEAKELSAKKWELLAENNGNLVIVLELIPELKNFEDQCAMCEYQSKNTSNSFYCSECPYYHICDNEYQKFSECKNSENAKIVYEAIVKINETI